MPLPPAPLYQSPPGSGSNDGAIPTVYDPAWQSYVNLTPAQIVAFQGFPVDLIKYAFLRRWVAEISGPLAVSLTVGGNSVTVQIDMTDRGQARIDKLSRNWGAPSALQVVFYLDAVGTLFHLSGANIKAIDAAVTNFIEQTYTTINNVVAGITAATPTITTRAQIDAAIAAVAPNSPSAKNPSPT